jgi:excisionase family DNA binding protein
MDNTSLLAEPDVLTSDEAGTLLRFSARSVTNYCRLGKLLSYRLGKAYRIPRAAVERLKAVQAVTRPQGSGENQQCQSSAGAVVVPGVVTGGFNWSEMNTCEHKRGGSAGVHSISDLGLENLKELELQANRAERAGFSEPLSRATLNLGQTSWNLS